MSPMPFCISLTIHSVVDNHRNDAYDRPCDQPHEKSWPSQNQCRFICELQKYRNKHYCNYNNVNHSKKFMMSHIFLSFLISSDIRQYRFHRYFLHNKKANTMPRDQHSICNDSSDSYSELWGDSSTGVTFFS